MDTIRNYLDNVFAALPKNEQTARLYRDLLATMEDKYRELKEAGRSENEAIGVVISEFGNIEELLDEMEISAAQDAQAAAPPAPEAAPAADPALYQIGLDEADAFLAAKQVAAILIGVGVFLCIMGPGLFVLLEVMAPAAVHIGYLGLFAPVAVGVALFIRSGLNMEPYKFLEKEPFCLTGEMEAMTRAQRERFASTRAWMLIAGIGLCILSPVSIFLFGSAPTPHFWYADALGILLFLFVVGAGVCLIVVAEGIKNGYDLLLQEGEHDFHKKQARKQDDKLIAAIAAAWWPLTTAGYLLYSFLNSNWHISWIIWPVSAILFGAVSGVCAIVRGERK